MKLLLLSFLFMVNVIFAAHLKLLSLLIWKIQFTFNANYLSRKRRFWWKDLIPIKESFKCAVSICQLQRVLLIYFNLNSIKRFANFTHYSWSSLEVVRLDWLVILKDNAELGGCLFSSRSIVNSLIVSVFRFPFFVLPMI